MNEYQALMTQSELYNRWQVSEATGALAFRGYRPDLCETGRPS